MGNENYKQLFGNKQMVTLNDFRTYYKTISNTELLSILDNPDDYQALAVEAAKEELANRNLADLEIQEARQPNIDKQKDKKRKKINVVENKVKAVGNTFIDTINPIQSGIHSTEKSIRLILITCGGIFLYQFIKYFKAHLGYVKDISRFPFESIIYLLPQIILPVAIIAFWKRKKIGWTLLTVCLTYSGVGALWLLFQSFFLKPIGFSSLDNLFPRPNPTTYFIQLLFLVGTLYVLCKKNIRDIFSIDKEKMWAIIGITGFVSFIVIYAIT